SVQGIQKRFPGVHALENVSFSLKAGEVHVLVGENGAGKSTLLKILSGALQPDEGEIRLDDEPRVLKDPKAAADLGIATIYQELSLVPWLSVAQNLFLGREHLIGGRLLSRQKTASLTKEVLNKIGVTLNPDTPIIRLGVAEQQLVEIARALSQDAKYILMDEPTASLTEREIDILFTKIRTLRQSGVGILYISHRLEEIAQIADRITVMRDGTVVHSCPASSITLDQIVTHMVGRPIANHYPKRQAHPGDVVLEVQPLGIPQTGNHNEKNLPFYARSGEVVGIAGLVGAGRTEWARRIFGADRGIGEQVTVFGSQEPVQHPHKARKLGLGMVPENRKDHGIILGRNVRENITVTLLESLRTPLGWIDRTRQRRVSGDYKEKLSIRCPSDLTDIDTLSGGNQQKAVLAKWLACDGRIIILDEPTRGIDVGAKLEMYNIINDLCAQGKAVILISSDLPELLSMSDRIYIMRLGRFVAELPAGEADQETIIQYASGLKGRDNHGN
ncbi:MAG: sugar ABC transporter ATP-binding protein, partial [Spirochaetales bacterium]|nr:sugar ABC transporter ATP-binding protein [Spirochaetales bacterium]